MDFEEILVKDYAKKVLLLSRRYFLFGGDGDDLYQEGMIGLITAVRTFDESRGIKFSTYADRCIKNRMIDSIRSHKYSEYLLSEDYSFIEESEDPEVSYIDKENIVERINCYKRILSKYEYSVLTYFLEGYTYSEIAEIFGKTSSSVYNAIQRIRQKLSATNL